MSGSTSQKRALVLSFFTILMCLLLLIGSTFAWFSDNVVSSENKIESGDLILDLELLDKDTLTWSSIKEEKTPLFSNDKWEPGYTDVKVLKIENEGTLSLRWEAKLFGTSLTALADVIDVYVLDFGIVDEGENIDYPSDRSLVGYTRVGSLREFLNVFSANTKGVLGGGEAACLGIALKMQENAGNEYQGLSLGDDIDIKITATQASLEEDTFGSNYDEDIVLPLSADSPQSLKEAMLTRDAVITLERDIVVDSSTPAQWGSYMFVANGRNVTIDLNGHDIILDETTSTNIQFLFTTANGGTLNIVGEGNLVSKNNYSGICWAMNKNDQINIYGGNYDSVSQNSSANALIYTTSGSIDVYGGKFYRAGGFCSNVANTQGDRVCIVFHEGVMFIENDIQSGDANRIKLAEGCVLKQVEEDGETWYKVVKE